MDSAAIHATLLYLLTFRLAVIALGALCIYLGYRLFVEGFGSGRSAGGEEGSSLGAKIAGHELSLKNAAPGTLFAAFGAIITITILASSPPQFSVTETTSSDSGEQRELVTALRGGDQMQSVAESEKAIDRFWRLYDQSRVALADALADSPQSSDLLELQAALLMVEGGGESKSAAQAALERAIQADPQRAEELKRLLALYRQFGQ